MRSFFRVLPDPPTKEMKDRFRKNGKNVEEEEEEEEKSKDFFSWEKLSTCDTYIFYDVKDLQLEIHFWLDFANHLKILTDGNG